MIRFNETAIQRFYCELKPLNESQWQVDIGPSSSEIKLRIKISIYDHDLLHRGSPREPFIAMDLIELGIVVAVVDRAIQPDLNSHCIVEVILPVRRPDLLSQGIDQLVDILHWYTGYEWSFTFKKRNVPRRTSESQLLFDLRHQDVSTDVALWSGGLDCLAGLYNRAFDNPDREFILCGTGSNTIVHNLQKRIVGLLPTSLSRRIKLAQIHYGIKAIEGVLPRNARLRSRGFTFMLIGSVCAYLEGISTLQVYENGIGAVNLRFRDSEIGLNHARSVHPLSLIKIGQWLTHVLGDIFVLQNPFLFWTKAQMCQRLLNQDGLDIATATRTCDRQHRNRKAQQCGQCSSCILRRHAFAALTVDDKTPYVYNETDWLYRPIAFQHIGKGNHIPSALYQVDRLKVCLESSNPWNSLVGQYETLAAHIVDPISELEGIPQQKIQSQLMHLFNQYVSEWQFLRNQQSKGLKRGQHD